MERLYYECGNGWEPLILEVKELVDKYNSNLPNNKEPLEFIQIKEKWGGLRIYLNYYPNNFADMLEGIEERSWSICEYCGTDKNVTKERTHGWVMSLCPSCRKKELERHNQLFSKEELLDYPYLGIGEKPDRSSKYASEDKLEKMIL